MGYDGSMMNGLNILPSYTDYFHLTTSTLSFSTSCIWIGGVLGGLTYGKVTDILGRRKALFWAAIVTLFSAIIQSAAQNLAMFIVGRMMVGYGIAASGLTGPAYLAETLPFQSRAWGLGILDDFWYVGGLIAAAVTYQSSKLDSTWAWRLPSAVQGVFSILCIIILPFLPESPRWLIYVGRNEEALRVVAQTIANGDVNNALVLAQYKDIVDTIEREKNSEEMLTLKEMVKTPVARKRMSLAVSVAVISTISGTMLNTAGIKSTSTQLLIQEPIGVTKWVEDPQRS
ncbi:hypothetical protein B7494_g3414 [Chlorociboria aeruginascens]|nr:hypothetical protein B7494_g3414 [Chlorociboria aeruginascens]